MARLPKEVRQLQRDMEGVHPGYLVYGAPELVAKYPQILIKRRKISKSVRILIAAIVALLTAQAVVTLAFYDFKNNLSATDQAPLARKK